DPCPLVRLLRARVVVFIPIGAERELLHRGLPDVPGGVEDADDESADPSGGQEVLEIHRSEESKLLVLRLDPGAPAVPDRFRLFELQILAEHALGIRSRDSGRPHVPEDDVLGVGSLAEASGNARVAAGAGLDVHPTTTLEVALKDEVVA